MQLDYDSVRKRVKFANIMNKLEEIFFLIDFAFTHELLKYYNFWKRSKIKKNHVYLQEKLIREKYFCQMLRIA